jgi:arsenite-transporting ATPase
MLGRLGVEVFAQTGDPWDVLFKTITQEIVSDEQGATLRIAIPFASKEEIALKQVGLELIITAAGQRRTIALPPKLAALQATAARYEDGTLQITFSRGSE